MLRSLCELDLHYKGQIFESQSTLLSFSVNFGNRSFRLTSDKYLYIISNRSFDVINDLKNLVVPLHRNNINLI